MAKVTTLVSDLSGEAIDNPEDGRTLEWAFDGQRFEIDLTTKEIDKLRADLTEVLRASTQVSNRPVVKGAANSPKHTPAELAEIRHIARELGHEVADRGRIKQEILDAVYAKRNDLRPAND